MNLSPPSVGDQENSPPPFFTSATSIYQGQVVKESLSQLFLGALD